ncbi:M23 family metallopeptidase [Streptomyces fradiae]
MPRTLRAATDNALDGRDDRDDRDRGRGHGENLRSVGRAVGAVGPGRVVRAGYGRSYGYEVVIRHADGRYTQYAHLSRIEVSVGDSVSAGRRIARSGATGRVTGPHLHFEVRTGASFGSDVDPLTYLRAHGVRV